MGNVAGNDIDAKLGVNEMDRRILRARREAGRRSALWSDLFPEIQRALNTIQSMPVMQHDEHCHNLMVRIARAGTMEDFADRVLDLGFHIDRIFARAAGSRTRRGSVFQPIGRQGAEPFLADGTEAREPKNSRHRLRL